MALTLVMEHNSLAVWLLLSQTWPSPFLFLDLLQALLPLSHGIDHIAGSLSTSSVQVEL